LNSYSLFNLNMNKLKLALILSLLAACAVPQGQAVVLDPSGKPTVSRPDAPKPGDSRPKAEPQRKDPAQKPDSQRKDPAPKPELQPKDRGTKNGSQSPVSNGSKPGSVTKQESPARPAGSTTTQGNPQTSGQAPTADTGGSPGSPAYGDQRIHDGMRERWTGGKWEAVTKASDAEIEAARLERRDRARDARPPKEGDTKSVGDHILRWNGEQWVDTGTNRRR
jgi:hypothetical protein